jgi:hypothetical protein
MVDGSAVSCPVPLAALSAKIVIASMPADAERQQ